jgi:chloramphenicol 3-O-phosphotransferase
MRPRFLAGFHRCLPALAGAGNDLIAGHITEFRARREDLARLLEGLGDFLARVRCDLAEIGRRERGRDIAVSERCARCPARVRNRAGDRCQACRAVPAGEPLTCASSSILATRPGLASAD